MADDDGSEVAVGAWADRVLPIAVAGLAGVVGAASGSSPTGSSIVDGVLLFVAFAGVTFLSTTAPWWALAIGGAAAAIVADGVLSLALGILVLLGASLIGARRVDSPVLNSVCAAATLVALASADLPGVQGLTALVGVSVGLLLLTTSILRRPPPLRRRLFLAAGGIGGFVIVAAAGMGIAAQDARDDLGQGVDHARDGIQQLREGGIEDAAAEFAAAAAAFEDAEVSLTRPWSEPARLLPMVAQNRDALTSLTAVAADSTRAAASALALIDPDSVRIVHGRIDVDSVRGLATPFDDLARALDHVDAELGQLDTTWLVAPLGRGVDDLSDDLDENRTRLTNAQQAVALAPAILGSEGPRRYFIAFTTPVEARGLGGFMGNWAELTIDDGKLEMTDFGRSHDLDEGGADPDHRRPTIPEWFPDPWRRGLVEKDGTTHFVPWLHITMAPDFPTVARLMSELYPVSGGKPVDGVFLLDVQSIAALMQFTGPISVPGIDVELTTDNTAEFLLRGQYEVDGGDAARADLLEQVATTTVDRLLSSSLPPPMELAEVFGPLAQEGRLSAWSTVDAEQSLFTDIGVSGSFPARGDTDGVAVVIDNEAGNKMDAFLEVDSQYTSNRDPATDVTSGTYEVRLTNAVPSIDLPDYVTQNLFDLPRRTNRARVWVYTAMPVTRLRVDGAEQESVTNSLFGWYVTSTIVVIPPGETVTVTAETQGEVERDCQLLTRVQPLTEPTELTATCDGAAVVPSTKSAADGPTE